MAQKSEVFLAMQRIYHGLEYPTELRNPMTTNGYIMHFNKNERCSISIMKVEGIFSRAKLDVA